MEKGAKGTGLMDNILKILKERATKKITIDKLEVPNIDKAPNRKRIDMPQVSSKNKPDFYKWLEKQDVKIDKNKKRDPSKLIPTQNQFNSKTVERIINDSKGMFRSPVLITNNGYILDGHHRWLAAYYAKIQVPVDIVYLKPDELFKLMMKYPKVERKDIKHEEFEYYIQQLREQMIDLEEVVSQTERRKRANRLKVFGSRIRRKREIALKRTADIKKLKKRSRRSARAAVGSKLSGGKKVSSLSTSRKIALSKQIDKKSSLVSRLTQRGIKDKRKLNTSRLSKRSKK